MCTGQSYLVSGNDARLSFVSGLTHVFPMHSRPSNVCCENLFPNAFKCDTLTVLKYINGGTSNRHRQCYCRPARRHPRQRLCSILRHRAPRHLPLPHRRSNNLWHTFCYKVYLTVRTRSVKIGTQLGNSLWRSDGGNSFQGVNSVLSCTCFLITRTSIVTPSCKLMTFGQ
jgi:hypothetical protein